MSIQSIEMNGQNVPLNFFPHITEDQKTATVTAPKFIKWVYDLTKQKFNVLGIEIRDVFMFGKNVGFVFAKADIPLDPVNPSGTKIPGVAFIRGGAVGILTLIKSRKTNQLYSLMTVQSRVPIGKMSFVEIPAGMLDTSHNFAGVAAQEMKEETGLTPTESDLIHLTNMFPSAGGCDEVIGLFCYGITMSEEEISVLQGKCTGLRDHGESIKLLVSPLETQVETCEDGKFLSAFAKYNIFLSKGKLTWTDEKLVFVD